MEDGLRKNGFSVFFDDGLVKPGDFLLTWNLHGDYRQRLAQKIEANGGKVIIAEEGYTRGLTQHKHFALSLGGHNGSGETPDGGPERFEALNISLKPWKTSGDYVLVAGQRGIGSQKMASPPLWHERVRERLKLYSSLPIVVRPHPGKDKLSAPNLDQQLDSSFALVVWSSSVAVRALAAGVPVFFEAPAISVQDGCWRNIRDIDNPLRSDVLRQKAMNKMSWMQWSVPELSSGEAFARLLGL